MGQLNRTGSLQATESLLHTEGITSLPPGVAMAKSMLPLRSPDLCRGTEKTKKKAVSFILIVVTGLSRPMVSVGSGTLLPSQVISTPIPQQVVLREVW